MEVSEPPPTMMTYTEIGVCKPAKGAVSVDDMFFESQSALPIGIVTPNVKQGGQLVDPICWEPMPELEYLEDCINYGDFYTSHEFNELETKVADNLYIPASEFGSDVNTEAPPFEIAIVMPG